MGIKSKIKKIVPEKLWTFAAAVQYMNSKESQAYREGLKFTEQKTKGEKTCFVFVVTFPETWNSLKTVFEAAINNPKCEAFIVALPRKTDAMGTNPAFDYLAEQYGDAVIDATGEGFSMRALKPDYVFYARPYNSEITVEDCKSDAVCRYARVCYIPYGFLLADRHSHIFTTVYNVEFLMTVNKVFIPGIEQGKDVKRKYGIALENDRMVYLGFPRFDLLPDRYEKNERKKVLWLPRWAVGLDNLAKSSFMEYINPLLDYFEKRKDVELIIRPHPLMFPTIIKNGVMEQQELETLRKRINDSDNVHLDETKDYMNSLCSADILLADFTSLLPEFFVSGKPIIYCDNETGFNDDAKEMLSTFYHCEGFTEVAKELNKLIADEDELQDERQNVINKMLCSDEGHIGENIIEYLLDTH